METNSSNLATVVASLERFYGAHGLTSRIAHIESQLVGQSRESISLLLGNEGITSSTLAAALEIKRVAGQVNVAIHAIGIALALPAILEAGEVIVDTSLGAGSTGRGFDLETDRRIAEFKFTKWRGGAESVRQNELFADVFHLAEAETQKKRELYVTELGRPLRFLENRRSLTSVLAKRALADEFFSRHGNRYTKVRDYWTDVKDRISFIDVTTLVPAIAGLPPEIEVDEE